jgi:hypothetical protein
MAWAMASPPARSLSGFFVDFSGWRLAKLAKLGKLGSRETRELAFSSRNPTR